MGSYRVRNADGELTFPHFADLERAYRDGLVDPEDEVLEENATIWKRADSLKLLAHSRSDMTRGYTKIHGRWYLAAMLLTVLGACGLLLIITGRQWMGLAFTLLIALALSASLTYFTFKSFRRKPNS